MEWRRLINGGEINAVADSRCHEDRRLQFLLSGSSPVQLKVPQTTDPAAIAKLGQYGLTPGGNIPGNIIPSALLSSNATAVLKAGLFPGPNTASGRYYTVNNKPTNYREETFRVDHQVGSKLALMGSLLYDNGVREGCSPIVGRRHV